MKKMFSELRRHPIVIAFFVILAVYTVVDCCINDKKFDAYENRTLNQKPAFSWSSLWKNEWTKDYENYINDQFAGRHQWIVIKSACESALGKTENNNVVYGADGYQFYKFTTLAADKEGVTQLERNIGFVENFLSRHNNVSVMIAPSASNILADKLPAGAPLLNENPYLDDLFGRFSAAGADVYDLRGVLSEHRSEYIYYRTDHHWTSLGAWLAYSQYASDKGLAVFDPAAFTPVEVPGFTGTNYNKSLKFRTVPDTITYYPLDNTLTVEQLNASTGEVLTSESGALYDYSKFDTRDKYAAFLRGNNGYSTIPGSGTGRVLVIKDSYANCFVPYLTASYAQIDVVDLRYWKYNVETLCEKNGYDDILLLYNFQTFSSEESVFYLNAMVK